MSNTNGSNNGNHGAAAVATRNVNGHRPDAAPASSAGQAIPTEHDLLWDGLSPAVTQALGQPLEHSLASQRKGRGGRVFDYLEGHVVIDQANRIFGYGGWGYEVVGDVTLRHIEAVDPQTGEIKTASAYSAPVRVTVAGALPRTDIGIHPVADETVDGHDTALKGAVTDGMKRAFRSFGLQFGNGFYGDQTQANGAAQPQRVPAPAHANGTSTKPQAQAESRSETQAERLRKRLFEITFEQGFDEEGVRTAVENRTGKSVDDLSAAELGPLVEAAANKLRQMQQAQGA